MNTPAQNIKKKPERKCVACQLMKQKNQLIRVVRNAEGIFSIDPIGKMAGRGAYICLSDVCFADAKKGKKLERAFKCAVSKEVYDSLEEAISKL